MSIIMSDQCHVPRVETSSYASICMAQLLWTQAFRPMNIRIFQPARKMPLMIVSNAEHAITEMRWLPQVTSRVPEPHMF